MTCDINQSEKNSILFYQGAIDKIQLDKTEQHLAGFYRVPNAYEVINMLLMPGMDSEINRIQNEKRDISAVLLHYFPELLNVYCNLYSAMCKYTYSADFDRSYTYRVDRMHMLCCLEQGKTGSFLSTTVRKPQAFNFSKKNGILLLEIDAPGSIEHLDINDILGNDSIYSEEQEILFAPFLYCDIQEKQLDHDEEKLRDANNEPPKKKLLVKIKSSEICGDISRKNLLELESLYEHIVKKECIDHAITIWNKLKQNESISHDEEQTYVNWKMLVVLFLKLRFNEIKYEQIKDDRIINLKTDLQNYISYSDYYRVKYDKQLEKLGMAISILQPIGALMVALSLLDANWKFEIGAKIASLIINAGCLILTGIIRNLSLEGKVQQRTRTYLRLDELRRDMKYEQNWSTVNVDKYVERFKQIINEDDTACEQNKKGHVSYLDEVQKKINKQ